MVPEDRQSMTAASPAQLTDLGSVEIDTNRPNRKLLVQQPGLKVMHVTLAMGQRLPPHRHPGCYVLLQALEGTTTVQLEGDGTTLSSRQLLSFSGENLVSLWNDSNATSVLLITLVKQVHDKEEE